MTPDLPKNRFFEEEYFTTGKWGGYSANGYNRTPGKDANNPDDQGERFKTQHRKLFLNYLNILAGKKALDIGCAKGFLVEDLCSWGVDCIGIDGNAAAIANAAGNCQVADLREYLPTLSDNSFDTIIAQSVLPCLDDDELAEVIPHIMRVAQNRIIIVDDFDSYIGWNPLDYENAQKNYNIKKIDDWKALLPGCEVTSKMDWL